MKNLILTSILFLISLISFSQKYLISVSSFEFSTMVGNKNYDELIFNSKGKVKIEVNENFILDLKEFKISTSCGNYKSVSNITKIDTLSKNVFLIKYNEGPKNDPSIKTEITFILDVNKNNQKIIQSFFDVEDNFSTLKTSSKYDLIVLTTN
jgi:hypothetical protein